MSNGIQWIDALGATLARLSEHGRLWVVERMPPLGAWKGESWEASAEARDRVYHLMGRWAEGHISDLPRETQARSDRFLAALAQCGQVTLVVHDAGNLKGATLDHMRLLAEAGALVVLVGDVSQIDLQTRSFPGFFQRAAYCIQVSSLFEVTTD